MPQNNYDPLEHLRTTPRLTPESILFFSWLMDPISEQTSKWDRRGEWREKEEEEEESKGRSCGGIRSSGRDSRSFNCREEKEEEEENQD